MHHILSSLPLLPVLLAPSLLAQTATYAVFTPVAPAVVPPDRDSAQLVFDEARGRALLAGGRPPGSSTNLQDTWEWDGTTWQHVLPNTQLNFSQQVRLVYSPQRAQVLAVTGDNTFGGPPMKIWGWTGSNWLLVDGNGPISRADAYQIAWDGQRGVLVMFGSPFGADTWEWNGLVWQQKGSGGPVPRTGHRMVYDEARQRVVLYGGISTSNMQVRDTWDWNGVYWLEHFGVTPPPTCLGSTIAYDRARQRVVLHGGGWNGTTTGGVFEFDGATWVTRTTSGAPASMSDASMTFVPATGSLLLFGGISGATWDRTRTIDFVTGYVAASAAHQPGCAGPAGVPSLAALGGSRPVLGSTFQTRYGNLPNTPLALVFAALGYSDQAWNGVPLPIDLTLLGFTGCQLHIAPSAMEPLSNTGGIANWSIPIPAAPSLDGLQFYLQGLVLTPGFNPGGAVTSSSLRCTAGVL
ncbi:MAG TPA: hypothetical protein VFZ65_22270 [Planctomycetota bacterium]|nr:hypothetical protein [Planctomycetota bacterium]